MDEKRNGLNRRVFLRLGFGVLTLGLLAACGSTVPATNTTATQASVTIATATQSPATQATATYQATSAPTATVAATTAPSTAGDTTAVDQGGVYQIDTSKSKATFTLGEKLLGQDNTVVGTTTKINGNITASLAHPADAKVGVIQIDATAIQTDSGMRDGMIQRAILESQKPDFKYITFEPTAIEGLPSQAASIGASIQLKITGNLKIRNITQPVTFDTTLTVKSDSELDGVAKTTVTRKAFQLNIPTVPRVSDVTDDVGLEFQFVALKQ